MTFIQEPPRLANQFDDDRVLGSYLRRALPSEMLRRLEPELSTMGELAAGELYRQQLAERHDEPRLTRWNAWGQRVDEIELTPLWRRCEALAAETGLVAIPYEAVDGSLSRIHQFALVYLFMPSTDVYSCPLAMSDGAARTLLESADGELVERAVPRLISRDPRSFWTSGQWMTETTGGSDVGRSETVARRDGDGWRLWGRKWFTSATSSQMALTLARPEGNPAGSKGLALFFVETRDPASGRLRQISIHRLKDKLGTRKVPTAELELAGTPARLVGGPEGGVRRIAPMLNVTRTWNAVSAVALMRRAVALARSYAFRRQAFGAVLAETPLHLDTLGELQAELEGAFHLTFRVVELLGRVEQGEASDGERALLRVLTPVMKLTTAKQAVAVTSEAIEAFGGAGYVEDTGLPLLVRDAQVLPIWEGTTNVLSLDTLRALSEPACPSALRREIERIAQVAGGTGVEDLVEAAGVALEEALGWFARHRARRGELQAGARRCALTVGRAFELALTAGHAAWALRHDDDRRPATAARVLMRSGVARLAPAMCEEMRALGRDEAVARAEP